MEKDYKELYEETIIRMLKANGYLIMYIKKPTEEMQLTAVKQTGWAIQYIEDPSEEVQLEAVKKNPLVIQHIKKPKEEIQLLAAKKILLKEILDIEEIQKLSKILKKIEENKGENNGKRL